MTSSNGNIFRVTGPLCGEFTGPGEFPAQRPVTRSFDVFLDLRLNKRLSRQPWGWWFETPSWSLWRHRNGGVSWFTVTLVLGQIRWAFYTIKHMLHRGRYMQCAGVIRAGYQWIALQWRHNERVGVLNHRPHDCLLNILFRFRIKKTSKHRVTGICDGNSPVTGEFPAQRASNA